MASGRPVLARKPVLSALGGIARYELIGACVLPDEGIVEGLAGLAVPQERGFALVGHASAARIGGGEALLLQRLENHGAGVEPDLNRIVLHPARPGIDCSCSRWATLEDLPLAVKHDKRVLVVPGRWRPRISSMVSSRLLSCQRPSAFADVSDALEKGVNLHGGFLRQLQAELGAPATARHGRNAPTRRSSGR